MSGQVVDAAHGWVASERGVCAVVIVEMEPPIEGVVADSVAAVDAHEGPFVGEEAEGVAR
jgi:hypothetical protein